MIPVVILSLYLLIYGLELSLEQRRREISIHRSIGATADKLKEEKKDMEGARSDLSKAPSAKKAGSGRELKSRS